MNLNQEMKEKASFDPKDLLDSDDEVVFDFCEVDFDDSANFEYEEETLIDEVIEELTQEYEHERRKLYFQNRKYNKLYLKYYEIEANLTKLFYKPINLHSFLKKSI